MKKQRLLTSITCMLLAAVLGCNQKPTAPHRPPDNGVVVIPDSGHPYSESPSVFADEGGNLTFKAEDPNTTITVDFSNSNGTTPSPAVCKAGNSISGLQQVTCAVNAGATGDYTIKITKTVAPPPGANPQPPPPPPQPPVTIQGYVRPCGTGCK